AEGHDGLSGCSVPQADRLSHRVQMGGREMDSSIEIQLQLLSDITDVGVPPRRHHPMERRVASNSALRGSETRGRTSHSLALVIGSCHRRRIRADCLRGVGMVGERNGSINSAHKKWFHLTIGVPVSYKLNPALET